ncbi:TrbG/VirB9 family P-type conjugative transfer protein [Sphingobium sp. AN558]|uniref:TrbG/VirB9 family P-type conjugative transfer protein n=1 Tax=Sphingobium sp. AN558 TaxID=3133442 RepID=UPI0030BCFBE0
MIRTGPVLAAFASFIVGAPAKAETLPVSAIGDSHIQTIAYDPQQVVGLRIASGYAATIVFSSDERIESVVVGDSSAWQVQANRRADHLVVKPVGYASTTNMTVLSDQRIYNFTLYAVPAGMADTPYLLSFTYPPPPADSAVAESPVTGRYRMSGRRGLWPTQISDDGQTTTLLWPKNVRMPAVYQEERRGSPALVNGVMQDGAYRIQGVYRRLILLLGRDKAVATRTKVKGTRPQDD